MSAFSAGFRGYGFIAALTGILTLGAFLRFQKYAVFGKNESTVDRAGVPCTMKISMVILAAFCLLSVFLLMEPVKSAFLDRAVDVLLGGPAGYSGILNK